MVKEVLRQGHVYSNKLLVMTIDTDISEVLETTATESSITNLFRKSFGSRICTIVVLVD